MSILTSQKPIASILCATLIFGCLAGTVWANNTPVTDTLNSGIYSNFGTSYNDWIYDEAESGAEWRIIRYRSSECVQSAVPVLR